MIPFLSVQSLYSYVCLVCYIILCYDNVLLYSLLQSVTSAGVSEKQAAIHCASTKGEEYLDTLKALLKAPGIDLNLVDSNGELVQW